MNSGSKGNHLLNLNTINKCMTVGGCKKKHQNNEDNSTEQYTEVG